MSTEADFYAASIFEPMAELRPGLAPPPRASSRGGLLPKVALGVNLVAATFTTAVTVIPLDAVGAVSRIKLTEPSRRVQRASVGRIDPSFTERTRIPIEAPRVIAFARKIGSVRPPTVTIHRRDRDIDD